MEERTDACIGCREYVSEDAGMGPEHCQIKRLIHQQSCTGRVSRHEATGQVHLTADEINRALTMPRGN